jgi:hypothetical protein
MAAGGGGEAGDHGGGEAESRTPLLQRAILSPPGVGEQRSVFYYARMYSSSAALLPAPAAKTCIEQFSTLVAAPAAADLFVAAVTNRQWKRAADVVGSASRAVTPPPAGTAGLPPAERTLAPHQGAESGKGAAIPTDEGAEEAPGDGEETEDDSDSESDDEDTDSVIIEEKDDDGAGLEALQRAADEGALEVGSVGVKVYERSAEDAEAIAALLRKHALLFSAVASLAIREQQLRPLIVKVVCTPLRRGFDDCIEPCSARTQIAAANTAVSVFRVRTIPGHLYPASHGQRDATGLWYGTVRLFADTHDGRIPLVRIVYITPYDLLEVDRLVQGSGKWADEAADAVADKLAPWIAGRYGRTSFGLLFSCFVVFAWDQEVLDFASGVMHDFARTKRLTMKQKRHAVSDLLVGDEERSMSAHPGLRHRHSPTSVLEDMEKTPEQAQPQGVCVLA